MRKLINKHTVFAVVAMSLLAVLAQPGFAHDRDDGYRDGRTMPPPMMGWQGPGYGNAPWRHHQYGPMMFGRHGDGPFSELELSTEQRQAIRKIYRDNRTKMHHLQDELSDKRQDLYAMLDDDYDIKKVRKQAESMAALMADRIVMRAEIRARINKVLTAEQREQIDDFYFDNWY